MFWYFLITISLAGILLTLDKISKILNKIYELLEQNLNIK